MDSNIICAQYIVIKHMSTDCYRLFQEPGPQCRMILVCIVIRQNPKLKSAYLRRYYITIWGYFASQFETANKVGLLQCHHIWLVAKYLFVQ